MTDADTSDAVASPADIARSAGVELSDGQAGDASIDRALDSLVSALSAFDAPARTTHEGEGATFVSADALPDATDVLAAGRELHDVLQRRLDEAAG